MGQTPAFEKEWVPTIRPDQSVEVPSGGEPVASHLGGRSFPAVPGRFFVTDDPQSNETKPFARRASPRRDNSEV